MNTIKLPKLLLYNASQLLNTLMIPNFVHFFYIKFHCRKLTWQKDWMLWYSRSAFRSRLLARIMPSQSGNGQGPITLLSLGTTILFLKRISSWLKLSCWNKEQFLDSDYLSSSTRDVSLYLGSSFKISTIINLRRLNCEYRSESIGFEPKTVWASESVANSTWSSTYWCPLVNSCSLYGIQCSLYRQRRPGRQSLSTNSEYFMTRVPRSAGFFPPSIWFHWSTVCELNFSASLLAQNWLLLFIVSDPL